MDPDIDTVIELMRVPGASCNENEISKNIRSMLIKRGVPDSSIFSDNAHKRSCYGGQTGNLIVDLHGSKDDGWRLLTTHMDTIPAAVGSEPYIDGSRIKNRTRGTSLGADARAGCAVLIHAISELMNSGTDHPRCTFVFFVQEELGLVGSRNMKFVDSDHQPVAFNFDGEDPACIVNESIGVARMNITVHGVAAHASRPHNGISAAEIEAVTVADLAKRRWHGSIHINSKTGTANLGVIDGGTMSNQIMPELALLMEARSFDREFRNEIINEWKQCFEKHVELYNSISKTDKKAEVTISDGPIYDPFVIKETDAVVIAAESVIRKCGLNPKLIADGGGMDANSLVEVGIPAVGMGMGLHNAHQEDEWLDVEQYKTACQIATLLCTEETK
jgi:tripeptide aminopeptidase